MIKKKFIQVAEMNPYKGKYKWEPSMETTGMDLWRLM